MEDTAEFTNLKAAIKGARIRAGLTQEEAAKRAGLKSTRGWQEWETGDVNPVMRIRDIERALGLDPGYFLAQLTVLERLLGFEAQLQRMEDAMNEVLKLQTSIDTLLHRWVVGPEEAEKEEV